MGEAFRRLAGRRHCLFLDSARPDARLGRYSFLAADPFAWLEKPAASEAIALNRSSGHDSLHELEDILARFPTPAREELPPFQGGAAGLFGYELAHEFERLPRARHDEFRAPALAVGLYDVVLAVDHSSGAAWIISQGFPETEPRARRRRARERLEEFAAWLAAPPTPLDWPEPASVSAPGGVSLALDELAPCFPAAGPVGLVSNFSREGYLRAVARATEYIRAGDIFQVNLSRRLLYPAREHAAELYLRLRERNPATFAAYFDTGDVSTRERIARAFFADSRRPCRNASDQGHASAAPPRPRPIFSRATISCKARRTGPRM